MSLTEEYNLYRNKVISEYGINNGYDLVSYEYWVKYVKKDKQIIKNRLSWEEYALELAKTASKRSEDPYKKTGACALRYDKSVAGIGYNGAPKGIEIDWSDRDERRKRVIHSEINCLSYCKPGEIEIIACNLLPCRHCLQVISSYKIPNVIYEEVYDKDDFSLVLAKEFNINLIQISLK